MSLFKLDESYDYDNNQVYLEEGYYDFNELADWVLENLNESNNLGNWLKQKTSGIRDSASRKLGNLRSWTRKKLGKDSGETVTTKRVIDEKDIPPAVRKRLGLD